MPTIQTKSTIPNGKLEFDRPLSLAIRLEEDGPVVVSRPLVASDLVDLRGELGCDLYLNRGLPDVPLESVSLVATAQLSSSIPGRCEGFRIEAQGPDGGRLQREYGIRVFNDAASSLAQGLIAEGRMKAEDTYYWHIVVSDRRDEVEPARQPFSLSTTTPPLAYLTQPIEPLIERAETIGTLNERDLSVFYFRRALDRTEALARRGAQQHPAVETGAVLIGSLASCPSSGRFFAIVTDALELTDAQQNEFSLSYTGPTWARVQAILRARQAQPGGQTLAMLGQAHGHNFLPAGGADPCDMCRKTKVCGRTSVFASIDDRTWTRAVLGGRPWQLCHIFGLNARKEEVSELYGLRDNQLQSRGYYVIDEL